MPLFTSWHMIEGGEDPLFIMEDGSIHRRCGNADPRH